MGELLIPILLFAALIIFSFRYIHRFKYYQLSNQPDKKKFWSNQYIFDSIPSIFPTLGIGCTAVGITVGIWNFNTTDIQASIPELLNGLKLAFVATIIGIAGLIFFQKYTAIFQKMIDDDPGRPKKQTDELSALGELSFAITELKNNNEKQFDKLITAITSIVEKKIEGQLGVIQEELKLIKIGTGDLKEVVRLGNVSTGEYLGSYSKSMLDEVGYLRKEQFEYSNKAYKNSELIIKAMRENHELTSKKFDEFSELLSKNNTEALVHVMQQATEQFNAQMGELIDRLVKENFKELNASVQTMNAWQQENKEQIHQLTQHFQQTTETFAISSSTLREVADKTRQLVQDDGKLGQIVTELKKILIEDGKFQEVTSKLSNTITTLSDTTDSFEATTSKLNDWIKHEKNFKESAQILITKLEEFRDLNGDVWTNYRQEMQKAVSIVKDTSTTLKGDLKNINAEFYTRLNDTLTNLDLCIQRFLPPNRN